MTNLDELERGRAALARRAWVVALEALTAADALEALEAEDLERLGDAAFWSGHPELCNEVRERAFAAYDGTNNRRRAAFVACDLALAGFVQGAPAVGAGWLGSAQRLLEEEGDCAEQGHLARTLALVFLNLGDVSGTIEQAERMRALGARFESADLRALGLVFRGAGLVHKGDVVTGMAAIDEAMTAAVAGELGPLTAQMLYCQTMEACLLAADYRRAAEWMQAAERCYERQGISVFPGDCHVHRASLRRAQGAWNQAEVDARDGCEAVRTFANLHHVGDAFYEIGVIQLRRGNLDAADESLERAYEHGHAVQPGLALLRLARGKVDAAAASIDEALASPIRDRLGRVELLAAQVEIAVANADLTTARMAVAELTESADAFAIPALAAHAASAKGRLALADGDHTGALTLARVACRLWEAAAVPYEVARTRMLLAHAQVRLGHLDDARLEARTARSTFERLGAGLDLDRATALIDECTSPKPQQSDEAPVARTLMFTDIVGSTELVQAIGDGAWRDLVHWHDDLLRGLFVAHDGEVVKHAGDGFFAAFGDPPSALACAIAIQRSLADHRRAHGFAPNLRIGLHSDEVLQEGADYRGRGVHLAARIGANAEGGEILASQASVDAGGAPGGENPRDLKLKEIAEPIRVVSVAWRSP